MIAGALALGALALAGYVAVVIAWIVAEVRVARWIRTPDPDPWKRRIRRY